MFAGHFGAALAIKASEPRLPTWGALIGAGLLDLLFPIFVAFGLERISPTPGVAPGMRLDFIDWSHSLAMSLVWAGLYAALWLPRGRAVAAAAGVAVFSHFVLDWPMHPGDLALWPHSAQHVGLGLWVRWPIGWWVFELAVVCACCGFYLYRAAALRSFGYRAKAVVGVVLTLLLLDSPWILGRM